MSDVDDLPIDPMDYKTALFTVRDYCCSVCWGALERVEIALGEHKGMWEVHCWKYGNQHRGFHTTRYRDQQRGNDYFRSQDVTRLLVQKGVMPAPPKRTDAEILKDLGFE